MIAIVADYWCSVSLPKYTYIDAALVFGDVNATCLFSICCLSVFTLLPMTRRLEHSDLHTVDELAS